jgi:aspartate-semialdehyde dehydrogenase
MSEKIPVAVLAATGSVGQRFIQLLDSHPWLLADPMPAWARDLPVLPTEPAKIQVPLVFSALPADIARHIEPTFAQAGIVVCSNASAYRRESDVPILLPEVNPEHGGLLVHQRKQRGWSGGIVTNPNCTSTGMTVALKALQDAFGLEQVFAFSMQALSGAGYPGVASMDIIDNVIPNIGGEEEKVEFEPCKMLGKLEDNHITLADVSISAHTNRVAVSDGHTVCLSIKLKNPASIEDARNALVNYEAPLSSRDLPSSPHPVIALREEDTRPQPRLDRMVGKGMTTVVGRVRSDPLLDLKLVVLSHNTIRGAAGGSIYNAELLVNLGLLIR